MLPPPPPLAVIARVIPTLELHSLRDGAMPAAPIQQAFHRSVFSRAQNFGLAFSPLQKLEINLSGGHNRLSNISVPFYSPSVVEMSQFTVLLRESSVLPAASAGKI